MTVDEQIQSYRISLELTKPKRLGTVKLIFNNIAQYIYDLIILGDAIYRPLYLHKS